MVMGTIASFKKDRQSAFAHTFGRKAEEREQVTLKIASHGCVHMYPDPGEEMCYGFLEAQP